jgi:hypothetical protein
MADAAVGNPHPHLTRTGIGDVDVVADQQRSAGFF